MSSEIDYSQPNCRCVHCGKPIVVTQKAMRYSKDGCFQCVKCGSLQHYEDAKIPTEKTK